MTVPGSTILSRRLAALLARRRRAGSARRPKLDAEAAAQLTRREAVVYTDTDDFTVRVARDGILHFLMVMDRAVREARPVLAGDGGQVVTQEIGIRMALGEPPAEVRRRFVRRSLRLAAVGVLVGTLAAFGLSKLISSLLFGVGPADPLTYGLVVLALTLTAAVAAYLPARRASQTDPARVLSSA